MKKLLSIFLCCLLLAGCGSHTVAQVTIAPTEIQKESPTLTSPEQFPASAPEYVSRFDSETLILLSDEGITVNGGGETDTVFTSHDIIYYEDRDTYESGNPYGEGEDWEKHTVEEAAAHIVVNITAPGAYKLVGELSAGQIRVDLGEDAYEDPNAVVELILHGADITCTVAPAILFLNTYECDGNWSVEDAKEEVDTSAAGANLILELENSITGSHVAKIYKDKDGEKKLWKQDGAIYSYMSMNIFGPASLGLTADNEGICSELHLTINGGNISIFSDNDGINTNEDGVSVTTINGGRLWINAGLGAEGDGIDSNGYLVINDGIVSCAAKPVSDAGLDSDLGTFIHGGTVIALGAAMNHPDPGSRQAVMQLSFAEMQQPGTDLVITDASGTVVFGYTPEYTEGLTRGYAGVILSSPNLQLGETYQLYTSGNLDGYAGRGYLVDVTMVNGYSEGIQMVHSGNPMGGFMGIPGGRPGQMPEDFDPASQEDRNAFPEGGFWGGGPENADFQEPGAKRPEGMEPPAMPEGEMPRGSFDRPAASAGESSAAFTLTDAVTAFTSIAAQ